MKLRHVFLSGVCLLHFLHAVRVIPCQGSSAVTQPSHKDMPKTLANQVCISPDNKASNFQIFVKCSPQRTLTTCFSNFPQTFTFWKML